MRKKKRHIGLLAVTGVLVISAGVLFAGRHVIVQQVKTKAAVEIGKRLLTEQFGSQINIGGRQVDVSQVMEQMDEEDVETITGIAEKYISPENIKQAAQMAASGDTEGLKALAGEQVSQEDKEQLQGLYEKYKDQIPANIP
ncbi:hypothetical protein D3Z36_07290 [Lachnospiraceae bacterium]|nr:hypothetical protein [Lachnospiraceae bacterium]